MQKTLKILIAIAICLAVGYCSGTVTRSAISTWYPVLIKPIFNPPNEVFAPVWTVLYIMMGLAAGLVWTNSQTEPLVTKKALIIFVIQLVMNALWSILFFGLKNPFLAFLEIILLWLLIYETYLQFKKINQFAANLLIPYLLWVSFATVLNGNIWWLNK